MPTSSLRLLDRARPTSQQSTPTAGCLFSGMGGFASGLLKAGFKVSWATDNDQYASRTFRHRFPDLHFIEKDIRELTIKGENLPSVDIVSAGFPCQSFSIAGNQRGFDDERGRLFFEIPRLITEFAPDCRPKLLILENVPNLLRGGNLTWFDEVRRTLRKTGYWFREQSCWVANVKDETTLPQDRERLFMVAASRQHFSYNPFTPPSSPADQTGCNRTIMDFIDHSRKGADTAYLPDANKYHKLISEKMASGNPEQNVFQLRRWYVREKKEGLCPTLTANMGAGGHNVPFIRDRWGIRRLSVDEVALLQGFKPDPSLFPDIPEKEQYRLLGNAACVHLVHRIANVCVAILRDMII